MDAISLALLITFIAGGFGFTHRVIKKRDKSTFKYFAQKSEEHFRVNRNKRIHGYKL